MGVQEVPSLIEKIRNTLCDLEQRTGWEPDDPAIRHLRHSIMKIIIEMELAKQHRTAA